MDSEAVCFEYDLWWQASDIFTCFLCRNLTALSPIIRSEHSINEFQLISVAETAKLTELKQVALYPS